jgi:hypothetical protein
LIFDDAAFEDKEEDILEVNSSIMSLYFISQCIFTQANPCLPMVSGSLCVLRTKCTLRNSRDLFCLNYRVYIEMDLLDLIFCVLTPLSEIFQLYHGNQF